MSKMGRYGESPESGQVILLAALGMVVLIGFLGLAIDGGRIYAQRRSAQNAADSAALAAARARCSGGDATAAARTWAAQNGYNDDGKTNTVEVHAPPTQPPYAGMPYYAEVVITTTIPGTFAQVVFPAPLQITVSAMGHCKPTATVFGGSTSCSNTVELSGSAVGVNGGVHSNNDLHITGGGAGSFVIGEATYVSDYVFKNVSVGGPPSKTAPESYPLTYNIADYEPGGAKTHVSEYHALICNPGDTNCKMDVKWLSNNGYFSKSNGSLQNGIYYTDGAIDLTGSSLTAPHATFVSRKTIDMSFSSSTVTAYSTNGDNPVLFSDYKYPTTTQQCGSPVISLSSASLDFTGNIFAPNGEVKLGMATVYLSGKIVGYTVQTNGSNLQFSSDAKYFIELAH